MSEIQGNISKKRGLASAVTNDDLEYIAEKVAEKVNADNASFSEDIENLSTEVEAIGVGLSEVESSIGNRSELIDGTTLVEGVNSAYLLAEQAMPAPNDSMTGFAMLYNDGINGHYLVTIDKNGEIITTSWLADNTKVGSGNLSGFPDLTAMEHHYANEIWNPEDGYIKYDITQLQKLIGDIQAGGYTDVAEALAKVNGVFNSDTIVWSEDIAIPVNIDVKPILIEGETTFSLAEGLKGKANEWIVAIQMGETEYDIALPEIYWGLGIAPTFSANTITQCRLYYIGDTLCGEWTAVSV